MNLIKLKILVKVLLSVDNPVSFVQSYLRISDQILRLKKGLMAYIRPNKIDYWIFLENLVLDTYNLKELKKNKFKTVIDIGSNIGLFSIAARSTWKKANLICVEPNPNSLRSLRINLELNSIKAKIIPRAVVGDNKIKKIKLYTNENPAMASTFLGKGNYLEVKTTTLSSLSKLIKGKTLLKIDIEGGEYDLLNTKNTNIFKKISYIAMETHDIDKSKNFSKVVKYFQKIGFKVSYSDRNLLAINASKTT